MSVHLSVGQEATAVGVCNHLTKKILFLVAIDLMHTIWRRVRPTKNVR